MTQNKRIASILIFFQLISANIRIVLRTNFENPPQKRSLTMLVVQEQSRSPTQQKHFLLSFKTFFTILHKYTKSIIILIRFLKIYISSRLNKDNVNFKNNVSWLGLGKFRKQIKVTTPQGYNTLQDTAILLTFIRAMFCLVFLLV